MKEHPVSRRLSAASSWPATADIAAPASPALQGRRSLLAFFGAGAALALGGCVVAPPGYYHRPAPVPPPAQGGVVGSEPPQPQAETAPPAPGPAYVWIPGYWAWHLGAYVWMGGRWALPPMGHFWVPGLWFRHGHGWAYRGGHWRR